MQAMTIIVPRTMPMYNVGSLLAELAVATSVLEAGRALVGMGVKVDEDDTVVEAELICESEEKVAVEDAILEETTVEDAEVEYTRFEDIELEDAKLELLVAVELDEPLEDVKTSVTTIVVEASAGAKVEVGVAASEADMLVGPNTVGEDEEEACCVKVTGLLELTELAIEVLDSD